MDEVRISNSAKTDLWIETEYNNQRDPASFHSVGSEEEVSQQGIPIPTLTEWGTTIFMTMIMGIGVMLLRERSMA